MPEKNPPIRSRIAPTPSGFLHMGNALNFVLTAALVRNQNGILHLRIDDLDAPRVRPEYVEDIFRTLEWLGLEIDHGPSGPEDLEKNFSQRFRIKDYEKTIFQLIESEANVFACTCSRSQIKKLSHDGQYPGTCRSLKRKLDSENSAFRIETPKGEIISWDDLKLENPSVELYQTMRDFVVRRKDGIPAYQIASLTDDINDGINLIVRGEDLKDSTSAQLFLSQYVDSQSFNDMQFFHHPLVYEDDGSKLSKSNDAFGLKNLYENGESSGPVFQMAARMMGIATTPILTFRDFCESLASSIDE